jgi:hypothetical protein
MAGEQSSPKVRMLLTIGIVAVCLLVAVKFALESYYLDVTENYERTLLPKTTQIDSIRAEERANLDKGPIPVSVAMQTLATKGRDNASAAIDPQPSDDPSPLIGWAQIPHAGPMPTLAPIPTTPEPAAADAGAMAAGDAGATGMATGDGGATAATTDAGAPHPAVVHDGGAPTAPHHAPSTATDGGH